MKKSYQVLFIDAWRDSDGGWVWNQWFKLQKIELVPQDLDNVRKLLNVLRKAELLSPKSRGKLAVEDDGYNMVIMRRHTREPILAVEYGPVENDPLELLPQQRYGIDAMNE
jgi:hypothetical protein